MKYILKSIFLLSFVSSNIVADEALFMKYADKSINSATLVERQGLKYQVNTNTPFSGRFITYEDEFDSAYLKLVHIKEAFFMDLLRNIMDVELLTHFEQHINGLEHGEYKEYGEEGYLTMTGK